MPDDVTITGIQEAQDLNNRAIYAASKRGRLNRALVYMTTALRRYAVQITHVWQYRGGGLKAAHREEVKGLRGRVFIDPSAVNPRGQRPAEYGAKEHARGGDHAFYDRTLNEIGDQVLERGASIVLEGLE